MSVRPAAYAGSWYPGSRKELSACLGELIAADAAAAPAVGIVVPHAGYVYSGRTAGAVYARVTVPDRVVVLSPNHRPQYGAPVSVWAEGQWTTPLGSARVDEDLAAEFLRECPEARSDREAHAREHSLELQIPFVQKRNPRASILPITLKQLDDEALDSVGLALARVIAAAGGDVLIVASSDMTHFETAEQARGRDEKALERVRAMDAEGLLSVVLGEDISMCGVYPVAAMLVAAKELGATGCELVEYTHSGMVTGDDSNVVAYAGLICR